MFICQFRCISFKTITADTCIEIFAYMVYRQSTETYLTFPYSLQQSINYNFSLVNRVLDAAQD